MQLRLYRVLVFFKVLEYNLSVGLLISTLVRNATVSLAILLILLSMSLSRTMCRQLDMHKIAVLCGTGRESALGHESDFDHSNCA